jgi:hypothetical protein
MSTTSCLNEGAKPSNQNLRDLWYFYKHVAANDVLRPSSKVVMFALLSHYNSNAGAWSSFPGMTTVAKETGMGRHTVIRGIDQLENEGWLLVDRRYDLMTKRNYSNRYDFVWDKETPGWCQSDTRGCHDDTRVVSDLHQGGDTGVTRVVSDSHQGGDTGATLTDYYNGQREETKTTNNRTDEREAFVLVSMQSGSLRSPDCTGPAAPSDGVEREEKGSSTPHDSDTKPKRRRYGPSDDDDDDDTRFFERILASQPAAKASPPSGSAAPCDPPPVDLPPVTTSPPIAPADPAPATPVPPTPPPKLPDETWTDYLIRLRKEKRCASAMH